MQPKHSVSGADWQDGVTRGTLYYWGTIEAALRDPDGFVLVFIAPYSEQELHALNKLTTVETVQPGELVTR